MLERVQEEGKSLRIILWKIPLSLRVRMKEQTNNTWQMNHVTLYMAAKCFTTQKKRILQEHTHSTLKQSKITRILWKYSKGETTTQVNPHPTCLHHPVTGNDLLCRVTDYAPANLLDLPCRSQLGTYTWELKFPYSQKRSSNQYNQWSPKNPSSSPECRSL